MSATVDGHAVSDLMRRGLIAHPSVSASVIERFGVPGSPEPSRVLLSRVLGGFEHEVLASRGLDIGYASWRGVPLSWQSPVSDTRPLDRPQGDSWLFRFNGGLLTTCGLYNIGQDDGVNGLHGDVSHRPAAQVTGRSADGRTKIAGTVEVHHVFGPSVSMRRTITSKAGRTWARLSVVDVLENTGRVSVPLAMLYHLNFGPPVAVPGTTIAVKSEGWEFASAVPEVADPSLLPEPCERVVEAVATYRGLETDGDGWAHALISPPDSMLRVDVAWKSHNLPYLHQWVYPTLGRWAFAVEPATAPLFDSAPVSEHADIPLLHPGQKRRHEIMITAREAS